MTKFNYATDLCMLEKLDKRRVFQISRIVFNDNRLAPHKRSKWDLKLHFDCESHFEVRRLI